MIQHQKLIPIHSFNNLKRIKLNKLPHIKPQSFYLPSHTKKPSPKPTILAPLPILPKVSYKIQKNANISAFPIDSSSSDSEQHENYDFESEKISFDIVEAYVSANCNKIAIKCIKDIISASLVLFSNYILDKYIIEVLNETIILVAKQAYSEIIDHNFIEYEDEILENELKVQISSVAETVSLEVIQEALCFEMFESFPLQEIIAEQYAEEKY